MVRWNTGILDVLHVDRRGYIILDHCGVHGTFRSPQNETPELMAAEDLPPPRAFSHVCHVIHLRGTNPGTAYRLVSQDDFANR